jgi:hypothetical protein
MESEGLAHVVQSGLNNLAPTSGLTAIAAK